MNHGRSAIASILLLIVLANAVHDLPGAFAMTQADSQQNEENKQQERQHQGQEIQKHMDTMLQQLPELIARQIQHDIQNKSHDQ